MAQLNGLDAAACHCSPGARRLSTCTSGADTPRRWGPLLGPGKLFDPTRFFIFCANVLGSPYGSASPCTRHGGEQVRADDSGVLRPAESAAPDGSGWWGPEFPATSTRDDVR